MDVQRYAVPYFLRRKPGVGPTLSFEVADLKRANSNPLEATVSSTSGAFDSVSGSFSKWRGVVGMVEGRRMLRVRVG